MEKHKFLVSDSMAIHVAARKTDSKASSRMLEELNMANSLGQTIVMCLKIG